MFFRRDKKKADQPAPQDAAQDATEAAGDPVSGSPTGFFKRPEALSPKHHATLRYRPDLKDYSFADKTRLAPITAREFARAALDYPIVFAGDQNRPCAVMGMREQTNLFIDAHGVFERGRYIPGMLRQHPFFLSVIPGVREPVLMMDRGAPSISETEGRALFEDGAPSEVVAAALKFLKTMQLELAATEQFTAALSSAGLIEPTSLRVAQRQPDNSLAESKEAVAYKAVDMKKFFALPAETRALFDQKGYTLGVFAHHISLQNWPRVFERAALELAETDAA